MELMPLLMILLENYSYLTAFIAAILSEETLLFLAILSGQGLISFWIVVVFGFIGLFVFDIVLFLLGKSYLSSILKKYVTKSKHSKEAVHGLHAKGFPLYLFLSKFIYGTRIITIGYYSLHKVSTKKFMKYNTLAILVWTAIVLPLGWMAGSGFSQLLNVAKGIEKTIAAAFFVLVIFYLINRFVIKRIVEKRI